MGRVSKTFWILDLGSWVVRLLKVQSLYGQLIDWESFDYIHQASVKNTLNFQQNYLKQLPGALDKILERSSISGPIHVLLPSSMFNYEFDLKHKNKLKVNLNESIRHEVNSLLAKKNLEAAFLGSGICAQIEYLRNKALNHNDKYCLVSINYSSSYYAEIESGNLNNFWQDTSINGMQLDTMMLNNANCSDSTQAILDWKKEEFALLPVYRPLQERLSEFQIIKEFLSILNMQLNQWENSIDQNTVYLSGGVTQLRNLDAYLEGTRTNQYESFCTSFFRGMA